MTSFQSYDWTKIGYQQNISNELILTAKYCYFNLKRLLNLILNQLITSLLGNGLQGWGHIYLKNSVSWRIYQWQEEPS